MLRKRDFKNHKADVFFFFFSLLPPVVGASFSQQANVFGGRVMKREQAFKTTCRKQEISCMPLEPCNPLGGEVEVWCGLNARHL